MKRKVEVIDVMVSIGMVATLLGAYAFFQVSNGGALTATPATNDMTHHSMKALVQAKLQPAIGQAIVDQAILERQFAADISRGSRKLASAIRAAEGRSSGWVDKIEARAAQRKIDHEARVQYVMGRSIVMLTKQGMRAGAISAENLSNGANARIIRNAQDMGMKMNEAFAKDWQPRIGQWIVTAAKQNTRSTGHMQERIGQATVNLASIQNEYQTKRAGLQTQYQALTAAAGRTAKHPELYARLPKTDPNWQWALGIPSMPQMEIVEGRTIPEIPFTYMMVATVGLVIMFFIGLTLPRGSRKLEVMAHHLQKPEPKRYRKAV